MAISVSHKGSFSNLKRLLQSPIKQTVDAELNRLGAKGVSALQNGTPRDSGRTAAAWSYDIQKSRGQTSLVFNNSHINNGVPIAIILQYGHGTGTGGYVQGRDYINPAIQPVFDEIAEQIGKAVGAA